MPGRVDGDHRARPRARACHQQRALARARASLQPPTLRALVAGHQTGQAEYKMATLPIALRDESGAPLLAARARSRGPTKNSRDPSIFGSPDPEAVARVPSRPAPPRSAPPRPAPRRAEWRRAGVTEGNLLRYLPRAPPPGPGQPPNLETSPASITRLACVSAARLQVLLPQPPAFEWRQCRSALLPSGRGWERTRRQGARFPGLGQLLERPLLVLGTLAC